MTAQMETGMARKRQGAPMDAAAGHLWRRRCLKRALPDQISQAGEAGEHGRRPGSAPGNSAGQAQSREPPQDARPCGSFCILKTALSIVKMQAVVTRAAAQELVEVAAREDSASTDLHLLVCHSAAILEVATDRLQGDQIELEKELQVILKGMGSRDEA